MQTSRESHERLLALLVRICDLMHRSRRLLAPDSCRLAPRRYNTTADERPELLPAGPGGSMDNQSPEMEKLYRFISKAANSHHPVLIQGESGTGKELVARSIHFSGRYKDKKFIFASVRE